MNIKVGDVVIDKNDRFGYIKSVCNCNMCKERGFLEPQILWIDKPDDYDYISQNDYKNGLANRFKRVGDKTFDNDVSIKTIKRIIIEAPDQKSVVTFERDVNNEYYNNFLVKKKLGEKIVKIEGETSDNKKYEIEIRGDYQLKVKY